MYDKVLVLSIVKQIDDALETIKSRTYQIQSANDFTETPEGMEKLDGVCMLFMAVGEALKNVYKVTSGSLLSKYPGFDWKGAMGFRDAIRLAFNRGVIEAGDVWMKMVKSRTLTSHTYNEEIAVEITVAIYKDYYPAFMKSNCLIMIKKLN